MRDRPGASGRRGRPGAHRASPRTAGGGRHQDDWLSQFYNLDNATRANDPQVPRTVDQMQERLTMLKVTPRRAASPRWATATSGTDTSILAGLAALGSIFFVLARRPSPPRRRHLHPRTSAHNRHRFAFRSSPLGFAPEIVHDVEEASMTRRT